ncbi:SRPBCC family protein [Flavobacterium suncheonense]|uniref:SRPBCC superfamily protein n=1 Tax=Flavobacterium suncheonense GH29-5 = DSM 17707 TaxID=1121899 RepID=A0A0A2M6L5_9FLAO|nr:SRPBCC family protein [Flavobacterium suncheonense]KGO88282.1 SRPBCC superfamily protein [Flavobacterium suncheonense GH29-5 = DSM 17707]
MKYTCEIEINQPVDKVIELFDNPDNLTKWMEGLESFEHVSGEPGQPGAKSLLKFKMGKRKMEMTETVTVRNLPEEFSGYYEMDGVTNHIKNKFSAISNSKTLYKTENEFVIKNNLVMKIFALLMPGLFKKQSMKYLESFKKFAESQP